MLRDDGFGPILRPSAYELGRALPRTATRLIAIQPHARVLCALAMAGEESTQWIVAWGAIGQPPDLIQVADPRNRDDQYAVFAALAAHVIDYWDECRAAGTFPQLWVSSRAGIENLDQVAERCRSGDNPQAIRRLGALLAYPTERHPYAGQQVLCAATEVLAAHWTTGQQPGEDDHLGAALAWIAPPADRPTLDAVIEAERAPMGTRTAPEFDRKTLEPLLKAYHRACHRGDATERDRRAAAIARALSSVVRPIYDATQRSIALLLAMDRPPLPGLERLVERECSAFAYFMGMRDRDIPIPSRDSPKAAIFGLMGREQAEEEFKAALWSGDRVARAAARIDGHVVAGTVARSESVPIGPRKCVRRFVLVSDQPAPRIRPRDRFWSVDGRLEIGVDDVRVTGGRREIDLHIIRGMRAVGLPAVGTPLELLPCTPEWGLLLRRRGQLTKRLAAMPWTHTEARRAPALSPAVDAAPRRLVDEGGEDESSD